MSEYLTSEQIRAARAVLRMSLEDLSDISGVPAATIIAIEATDGAIGDNVRGPAAPLRRALEDAGITFIDAADGGGPGLRIGRPQRAQEGIRPENLTAANDD